MEMYPDQKKKKSTIKTQLQFSSVSMPEYRVYFTVQTITNLAPTCATSTSGLITLTPQTEWIKKLVRGNVSN